ncbi:glycosyltransferase [Mucilaginibacter sp. 21P]
MSHELFEVIVCDDGSTDETELVVQNFSENLTRKG